MLLLMLVLLFLLLILLLVQNNLCFFDVEKKVREEKSIGEIEQRNQGDGDGNKTLVRAS